MSTLGLIGLPFDNLMWTQQESDQVTDHKHIYSRLSKYSNKVIWAESEDEKETGNKPKH